MIILFLWNRNYESSYDYIRSAEFLPMFVLFPMFKIAKNKAGRAKENNVQELPPTLQASTKIKHKTTVQHTGTLVKDSCSPASILQFY